MSTYQFDLTRLLEGLSLAEGVPKTQVIRRALAFLQFLQREEAQGHKLVIIKDSVIVREIVR